MQNISPISALKNYEQVLKNVKKGQPVILIKNGKVKYVVLDIKEYEEFTNRLNNELDGNRESNYYLIDYENIIATSDIISVIEEIPNVCIVFIFYSDASKNIPIEALEILRKKQITFLFNKAIIGTKNALDFQLSSYLGYLIHETKEQDAQYFIVSNDKGYDCLSEFYEREGISVNRMATLGNQSMLNAIVPSTSKEEICRYIGRVDEADYIRQIFNESHSKLQINNSLMTYFKDGKRVKEIFNDLKPLMREKGKK